MSPFSSPPSGAALRLAVLATLPGFGALGGCQQTCTGVGCEDQFAGALVGVQPGRALPESGTISPLDATHALAGTKELGPEADVALVTGSAWVGTAKGNAVRRFDLSQAGVLWPSDATATLEGDDPTDAFGASVSILGDLDGDGVDELGVGAPLRDASDEKRDAGSLYVFAGLADGSAEPSGEPWLRVTGEEASAHLGTRLRGCGDLDGDGRPDFSASAPWSNAGGGLSGSVFAALTTQLPAAGGTGLTGASGMLFLGDTLGERLGNSLTCDQDLIGATGGAPDGLADLIIGAPFANAENREAAGAVYLMAGGGSWTDGSTSSVLAAESAIRTLKGSLDNGWLGWSVASGDLDGDGLAEVVSGAPGFRDDADLLARGEALIWTGAELDADTSPSPAFRVLGEADGDGFGRAVLVADLTGDGLNDLVVGAPHHAPADATTTFESGAVYIFEGSAEFEGWESTRTADSAALRMEADQTYLQAGRELRSGDVDGDAKADLAIIERFDPRAGVP